MANSHSGRGSFIENFKGIYERNYKKFFIIPAIAVIFCLAVLGMNYLETGEFVSKGIDLQGGTIITIDGASFSSGSLDEKILRSEISASLAIRESELSVGKTTSFSEGGMKIATVHVEAPPKVDSALLIASLESALLTQGFRTNSSEYNLKIVGPAVGKAFLTNTYIALLLGFIFIGAVIFTLFRNTGGLKEYANKSHFVMLTVISCIFFDFLGGLAVMNLFGIKFAPLTLAALLMLIGFSIDSDILITTSVLKKHEGRPVDRAFSAMRTGVTMAVAASASLLALLFLSGSTAIRDMTIILLGGLMFDLIHTWFTNLGILFFLAEKSSKEVVSQ